MNDTRGLDVDVPIDMGPTPNPEYAVDGHEDYATPVPPRSPSRRKISEDLEHTPSPHKAGEQRNIGMPKPMKL